jgi:hypothetical protein
MITATILKLIGGKPGLKSRSSRGRNVESMSDELREALESVRGYKMTEEDIDAQRISFVYGNAPREENSTKEAVQRAVDLAEIA